MSDPVTAPDMESVIAAAIADHDPELDQTACPTGYCMCNERFGTEDAHAAHQARAVLAAISEAGTVEWGIHYGDDDIDEGYLHKSEALTDIARLRERVRLGYDNADDHEPMTLLTRRGFEHAGPWTAVEG